MTDQQRAAKLGTLRRLASGRGSVQGAPSMLAFLKGDIFALAADIAKTHPDPDIRALARELADQARRIAR